MQVKSPICWFCPSHFAIIPSFPLPPFSFGIHLHIEWDRGPRRTFQLRLSSLHTKHTLGNTKLFRFSQLQLRCSTSISGQQAISPQNEQRRTWLIFCRADRNISSKSLAGYCQSKKRKSKVVRRSLKKRKKKKEQLSRSRSTSRGRSCPPLSIDRRSPQPYPRCRSLSKSVVFGFFNGAFANTSSGAYKSKRAGWQGFWREHFWRAGRSLPFQCFHSPVRFLFVSFPSHGKSADLCSWAWLQPWLSTPGSVFTSLVVAGGLPWACITHCTTICAILMIDDLEKREACRSRSCPWLLTGITEQGNGNLSTSFLGGIQRCSRLCPWENGRNACVKHCFVVHLRSLSTHSSICFYFAVAVLHSGQPGFQLLLVRSSFFVW